MELPAIALLADTPAGKARLEAIAAMFHIDQGMLPAARFGLQWQDDKLQLRDLDDPRTGPVLADFVAGAVAHRRRFGGGRGQALARAVGLKSGRTPHVVDATAGLGRDAFVLAALGCRLTLIERHPVVAALLHDGLRRAGEDPEIGAWVTARMQLVWGQAPDVLAKLGEPADVVYLDPMFPHRHTSAQVKKEMRMFQSLVGSDPDADRLLPAALAAARARVVVKRPGYAGFLDGQTPSMSVDTRKHRFDVYVRAAL